MGLFVITTNKGDIPEALSPGRAVLLDVDETLPHRIDNAILNLYNHPERRK